MDSNPTQTEATPPTQRTIADALDGAPRENYGEHYDAHVLEQYKLYVELVDRVSQRRTSATNALFASVNTLLLTGYGALAAAQTTGSHVGLSLISLAGILLSICWLNINESYRALATAKFHVLLELEKRLPLRLLEAEWVSLCTQPRYVPLSIVEAKLPMVYITVYIFLLFVGFVFHLNIA